MLCPGRFILVESVVKFSVIINATLYFSDESLSIESPMHSEDFASTDLNFEEDHNSPLKSSNVPIKYDIVTRNASHASAVPLKGQQRADATAESVAIVNHGLIVSAKTNNVERVVIPEKKTKCCLIL